MIPRDIENGFKICEIIHRFMLKHKGHRVTDSYLHHPRYVRMDFICHDCMVREQVIYRKGEINDGKRKK